MEVAPLSSLASESNERRASGEEGGGVSSTESNRNDFDQTVEVSLSNGPVETSSSKSKQCVKSTSNCERGFRRNKKVSKLVSGSSDFGHCSTSQQRGLCLVRKRRNPKVIVGGFGGVRGGSDLNALGLPLGMSIAAVVAQVLERKNAADESFPVDHLSSVCSSAVEESLANVFGNRFDCFVRNFEKSFRSTLKTLRLINEASLTKVEDPLNYSSAESYTSEVAQSASHDRQGCPNSSITKSHGEVVRDTCVVREPFISFGEIQENMRSDVVNKELTLHEQANQQLTCISSSSQTPGINNSMLRTYEKSVIEQVRSNDLKTVELGLRIQELQLKESNLTLKSDLNHLERVKLKTQLQDTRHTELLKKCIDCFVAGLIIMSASLIYGAYIYSYEQLIEITTSCNPSTQESKSWWMPKQVVTFKSVLQMVGCQVVVASRMMFGVFMIIAIAYLLLQRPVTSQQSMPITFLLLGVFCGFVGKLCVDTLGGSGYCWLLYWEALCLLHFLANVCTSILFYILYGPISVSQEVEAKSRLPFWIRRFMFYAATLFLPLLCGLMPFASPSDWTDHFFLLSKDLFLGVRS